MRFQTKTMLVVNLIFFAALLGMGLWNFSEKRESLYQHTYKHMDLLLQETITNDLLWRLRRFLFQRVRILKEAAARIANQERAEQIQVGSEDELGALARSMEKMSAKLQAHSAKNQAMKGRLLQLNEALTDANHQLDALNTSIQDQVDRKT